LNNKFTSFKNLKDLEIKAHGSFLKQLYYMTKKELLIQLRYPVAFVAGFIQIITIIAFFTYAAQTFIPKESSTSDEIGFFTGTSIFLGFMLYNIMTDGFFNIGNSLRNEQITGTLESMFLTPSSQLANLLSRIAFTFITNIFFAGFAYIAVTLLIGKINFNVNDFIIWFYFVLTVMALFGFSFALAGLALKAKEGMQPLTGFLMFFFMIFCGFFFPVSVLGPLTIISVIIPFTWGVDLVKSIAAGESYTELANEFAHSFNLTLNEFMVIQSGLVIIVGILLPIFGLWYYNYTINEARRQGTLTQF
jgi:ABC-2 type transport system permease protein